VQFRRLRKHPGVHGLIQSAKDGRPYHHSSDNLAENRRLMQLARYLAKYDSKEEKHRGLKEQQGDSVFEDTSHPEENESQNCHNEKRLVSFQASSLLAYFSMFQF
jgi:hypothetical protein